ncbi:hypothetical protein [Micromonospora sp. C95]|uniref:hypothetical protein n=1 Tax=Micromonospora sp. C95 TaxID=2824882 RepID=UPI001B37460C|nr:hypothetical protein [Micromonospora sp. C95]MBQ1025829.1 hypothetical protein [Micromonospora sp. C95]
MNDPTSGSDGFHLRDRETFLSLVSAHSPAGARIQIIEPVPNHINATLLLVEQVEQVLGRRPIAALVHGGAPEAFSFTGFPSPNAAIGSSHLEMMYTVWGLHFHRLIARHRRDQSRRKFLELLGMLASAAGATELGDRCFDRAQQSRVIYLTSASLPDIDMLPPGDAYVAAWTFGMSHEFGHALDGGSRWSNWLGSTTLAEWIEEGLSWSAERYRLAGRKSEDFELGGASHMLEPAHLRAEIAADCFAIYLQFRVTHRLMTALTEPSPEPAQILSTCIDVLDCCIMIESCLAIMGLARSSDVGGLSVASSAAWNIRSVAATAFMDAVLPGMLRDDLPDWLGSSNEWSASSSEWLAGRNGWQGGGRVWHHGSVVQLLRASKGPAWKEVSDGFSDAVAEIEELASAAARDASPRTTPSPDSTSIE